MTIEFCNARPEKNYSGASVALLVLSCAFFFIPTTLIVLGYYSTLPTGTLISPLPAGIISNSSSNYDLPNHPATQPILATPIESPTATQSTTVNSNLTTKSATLLSNQTEVIVTDPDILPTSQIYLSNRNEDKSIYTVKNKSAGQMIIMSTSTTDTERTVDYHIVNP